MSEVDAWLEHVHELADAAGVELLPDDIPALLSASVDRGWDAQGTEEAFAAFVDEHFEDADEPDGDVYEDDELDHDEEIDVPDDQDDSVDPQLTQDLHYNIARTEERIGRKLTHSEVEQVGDRVRHELATGGGPREVAAAFEGTAAKPVAEMGHAEAVEFMSARLRDGRPTVADTLGDRGLDLDDAQDRQTYMLARLQGAEFESPDPVEPTGDESGFAGGGWE